MQKKIFKQKAMDKVAEISKTIPLLAKAEALTGKKLTRDKILLIFVGFCTFLNFFSCLKNLSNILLMICPLHETILLLQQPLARADGIKNLTMFWLTFAFFIVMDPILNLLFMFIPFFYTFRFYFLFLLSISEKNLCNFLLESVFKQIPLKFLTVTKIKDEMKEASKFAKQALKDLKNKVSSSEEVDAFIPKIKEVKKDKED